ncbi:HD-GYP domain-containing protein [Colwellia asteriadis]|uniref:HD-GYP domain-containing protein n=1 Tax=Colwellia asteriadis TaxID=517723 RepID=A0ABN1L2U6_9GAMM
MTNDAVPSTQKIAITDLKPGMYVLSITSKNKSVNVKTEGYIRSQEGIQKMVQAGITHLTIDPNKQKQAEKIDKILPDIDNEPEPSAQEKPTSVSLDQEMKSASTLYDNAKTLQHKILNNLTESRSINISEAKEATDAIVDSIFRNQDALACMSRLRIKDEYLVEHSLNVSILMSIFAKYLKLDRELIEQLALGAFLHDVGKVLIPPEVLHKPGKLTPPEYEIIKSHVTLGMQVLQDCPDLPELVLSVVKQHHERLDGTGYPQQLTEPQISQFGRMIAIVDSYDAMTAERVYKAGMHPIKAFKILMKESPTSYDNELVEQFVNCLGIYPIGTLVKLTSGKLGLISKLNKSKPLQPFVRVFYNTRLNQAIAMEEIDLIHDKHQDQIDCCIKPEEFNINLLRFFKRAFIE